MAGSSRALAATFRLVLSTFVLATILGAPTLAAAPTPLPGLGAEARILWDANGVPHIFAMSDLDASYLMGYVHAKDRFFQMDTLRHLFAGRLAELLGSDALASDVQLRTLGLERAAAASLPALPKAARDWLAAYAAGVNTYLDKHGLPPQYGLLELSKASVEPWTARDCVLMGKGLAFGLSFDLSDIERTVALVAYQTAGTAVGFNGTALLTEDLFRFAPFEPTVSIPGALGVAQVEAPALAGPAELAAGAAALRRMLAPQTVALARSYRDRVAANPHLAWALDPDRGGKGSNWWLVAGKNTTSGLPMIANDPHLALDSPSTFVEAHLLVFDPTRNTPANIYGVSFAGAPVIAQGCTAVLCWGSTVNPLDVTDVYQERLVLDPVTGVPVGTLFKGEVEPLVVIPQTYLVNQIGNATADDLVNAGVGPLQGGLTFVVPRRNHGPIVAVDTSGFPNVVGLSVQYTGWRATRELEAFRRWQRVKSLAEFEADLQFFDVGSQNFGVVDVFGNIAYWTSAEIPLREDLQTLHRPDGGVPPFFIRDGSGTLRHEWVPLQNRQFRQALDFEVLPFAEMPQVRNPDSGFIVNANNDPIGTTLDNNPLNQLRPGGGLYYLNSDYSSLRGGRIRERIDALLAGGGKISLADMEAIQANHQLFDAELATPFVLTAFENAGRTEAPASLKALADDPRIVEAVARLDAWHYGTPTGIPEGFDPGDDPTALPTPSAAEIADSVAATIFSVWRSRMVANTVDATLAGIGLADFAPPGGFAWAGTLHLLQSFTTGQGVGASGLRILPLAPDSADPADGRDWVILDSLADALDALAGDAFAAAFEHSEDQDDYRWGKLHRIVFANPIGGPFAIPTGGGFADLSPALPGIARSGGFGAVDASSHTVRAAEPDDFMFSAGPARRFVAEVAPGAIRAFQVIPGGQSEIPGSPFQADQLSLWLTNRYHPVLLRTGEVRAGRIFQEVFVPAE